MAGRDLIVIVIAIAVWEAARFVTLRTLRRRWQRSIGDFLRRHNVQLEQFRFIDRVWVRQALLQDPEIDRVAAGRAAETGQTVGEVRARVEEYLDEIVPFFNLFSYYKLGAAAATSAVRLCYELWFDGDALSRAREAVPAGAVTVYVSNHRSNADYVVLSVGAMRHVALSYAVGEWARVWPLDSLFRSFGSYFVRRGEKDPLYHTVLARYLQLVAARGLTTAFFLEGALSRDGALRAPKIGLLDYLVGILRHEPDREVYFVPVGVNFDRVLEDRNLVADAGARAPSRMEKFLSLATIVARAPLILAAIVARPNRRSHLKYGYAAVGFGKPIALTTLMPNAVAIANLPDDPRRVEMAKLADGLLAEVGRVVPATPVTVVCAALVDGATDMPALRASVRELLTSMRAAGRPLAFGAAYAATLAAREKSRDSSDDKASLDAEIMDAEEAERTIDLALSLLKRRGLVRVEGGQVRVVERILVRYYANSLLPPARFAARPAVLPVA